MPEDESPLGGVGGVLLSLLELLELLELPEPLASPELELVALLLLLDLLLPEPLRFELAALLCAEPASFSAAKAMLAKAAGENAVATATANAALLVLLNAEYFMVILDSFWVGEHEDGGQPTVMETTRLF